MIPYMEKARPFWEDVYQNEAAPGAFGEASAEIVKLAGVLPPGASVLDLGCGDGRNALFLAAHGFPVTCIDISEAAIRKLRHLAEIRHLPVIAEISDLRAFRISGEFDLIIAHGCLHLLERTHSSRVLEEMKAATRSGGYNVIAVFTDSLEPPEDLRPFVLGLFPDGWLFEQYTGWSIIERKSYLLEDEHPGGIRHRHAINKLVARREMGKQGPGISGAAMLTWGLPKTSGQASRGSPGTKALLLETEPEGYPARGTDRAHGGFERDAGLVFRWRQVFRSGSGVRSRVGD
jgi:tellurite methyltransferase